MRTHSHQPIYGDSETDFDAWAEQFMSRENLRELHAEHGYEWSGMDEASIAKSHWYYDPDLKYQYVALYVCLIAAILSFAFVKWQEASHDAGQHEGHEPHQYESH